MKPIAMTITILTLLVTASQLVRARESKPSSIPKVNLAVHFVYDRYFEQISKFRDESGRYLDYFTTFLNIVELRFRSSKLPHIKLTLHAATENPLNDIDNEPDGDEKSVERTMSDESSQEEDLEKSKTTYQPCRNRSVTMKKFKYHVETQDAYKGADVVIFVTGLCINLEADANKEWEGPPKTRSICTKSAVGVVHDDGKTFNGTRSAALQLALMLGANEDTKTNCRDKKGYLLSNMTGGSLSKLSSCTKKAISKFFKTQKTNKCGKGTPTPAKHNANMLAKEYYEAKKTDECQISSSDTQKVKKCKTNKVSYLKNKHQATCKVTCCNKVGKTDQKYVTNSADGTQCENEKICLSGNCIHDPRRKTPKTQKKKKQ
uniref:Putative secreted metalloprotease n=1 Tax=Ixodes ricinus TaxID=34613 RepID=A0A6B0VBG1_IXORI